MYITSPIVSLLLQVFKTYHAYSYFLRILIRIETAENDSAFCNTEISLLLFKKSQYFEDLTYNVKLLTPVLCSAVSQSGYADSPNILDDKHRFAYSTHAIFALHAQT